MWRALTLTVLFSLSVVLGIACDARAETRPTLAGRWLAGPLVERWNIGTWGDACGPRPTDRTVAGGEVRIRQEGAELIATGPGAMRTDDCWEKMPGVSRTSHSTSTYEWRSRCTSGPTDPRHATITTTITATDTSLRFDETGEYQFVIQNQYCTAGARRNRSYVLVQRDGEAEPAASATAAPEQGRPSESHVAEPASTATPTEERTTCAKIGDPARVEVKPAHKLVRRGEKFTFRTMVLDANGCTLDVRPTWTTVVASAGIGLYPTGAVVVADDAPEGKAEFLASLGGRGAHVFVEVVSPERYAALLSEPHLDGAVEDVAVGVVAAPALGGETAIAHDTARRRKIIFIIVVGTVALGLAALGLLLLRRPRSEPVESEVSPWPMGPPPTTSSEPSPELGLTLVVCAQCHRTYPLGSTFCPYDGYRLGTSGPVPTGTGSAAIQPQVPMPATAQAPPKELGLVRRGKICPTCGGRYEGEAAFCGKDGTALVLVN